MECAGNRRSPDNSPQEETSERSKTIETRRRGKAFHLPVIQQGTVAQDREDGRSFQCLH